ncbi:MAG: hypothetical protein GF331_09295 [Chitinivibrionales bacterium]|nr:hypothetical protein [Chitinivibrionales bacterium]
MHKAVVHLIVAVVFAGLASRTRALEPVTMLVDSSSWGYGVEDAVAKMQNGTPLNIVIFGQSVSERIRPDSLAAHLKRMYPAADITVRNISRGACSASSTLCDNNCICRELKNSPDKLSAFQQADLVIQHVYGWEGGFITLYNFFAQNLKPGAELAIWNDHAPVGDTTAGQGEAYNRYIGRYFKREQCEARGWAYVDVMTPWYGYLTEYGIGPGGLLIDNVHPNSDGSELLETLVASYFVSPSQDHTAPRLVGVEARSATRLALSFSEELDPSSAQTPANYTVSGGVDVTGAMLLPFGNGVILTTTPAAPGTHTVSVSNVADRSPNANTIDPGASSVEVAVDDSYGWASVDVGTSGSPGSAVWDETSCTISSAADATNDYKHECHYTFKPAYGDCRIVARLTAQSEHLDNGNIITNTMAGVAIRETDRYYSRFAIAGLDAGGEIDFYYRNELSGRVRARTTGAGGLSAPLWLRMTRTGGNIEADYSSDGSTWTSLGSVTLTVGNEVTIGLFAIGGKYNLTNIAQFSDVSVESGQMPVACAPAIRGVDAHEVLRARARGDMLFVNTPAQSVSLLQVFALDGALIGSWCPNTSGGILSLPFQQTGPVIVRIEANGRQRVLMLSGQRLTAR